MNLSVCKIDFVSETPVNKQNYKLNHQHLYANAGTPVVKKM